MENSTENLSRENLHYKNIKMNKRNANKERNLGRPQSPRWISSHHPFSEGGCKGRSYHGNTGKNKPEKRVVCKNGIYKKPVLGNRCIDSAYNRDIIMTANYDN